MLTTLDRDGVLGFYSTALGEQISHGDLGRLLREKRMPLPVRIDGEILWYRDELEQTLPKVMKILNYRKKH